MPVKMKQSLPPEIDTKLDGEKIHPGSGSNGDGNGFLEAETPKHCNRKTPAPPNYHNQGYPPYQGQSGSHSHGHHHVPNNYYGHGHHPQTAMISPGTSNRYQGYHGHGHGGHSGHGHSSQRGHGHYYPPASSNGYGPPPPPPGSYGSQPSGSHHMEHYNNGSSYPHPPPYMDMSSRYSQHPQQYGNSNSGRHSYPNNSTGQEFSRAVSSSFSESTNNMKRQGGHHARASSSSGRINNSNPNLHNNVFESRDDVSVAESDASWKQLNQVASIEEGGMGRFGATTPVDRLCPTLSSDMSRSPAISTGRDKIKTRSSNSSSKLNNILPLSSIPSMRESEDGNINEENANDLDLRLCATDSSGLLFQDEGSYKRRREERNDSETKRSSGSSRRRDKNSAPPSPPDMNELSVQEERDAPPSKRGRLGDERDREMYNNNLSMDNSSHNDKLPMLNMGGGRKSTTSLVHLTPSNLDEGVGGLDANMPSWDITGQDSFGGGFSVSSNLSDGHQDVLGNSFSFSNDAEFPTPSGSASHQNSSTNHHQSPRPKDTGKSGDSIGLCLNPSESMDLGTSQHGPMTSPNGGNSYPPPAPTWVTSTQSGGSFSMGSTGADSHGLPRHYPPPIPRNNSSTSHQHPASSHPPHYGSMPPHHHPYGDGRQPYQPRAGPGPYGMPPRPQGFLPPSFRPPPPGMAGPSMPRSAPPPVYMMASPPGTQGMSGGIGKSQASAMSKGMGGAYNWNKNDDARLSEILKKFKNPKNWEAIAKEFGEGRTAKQCNERWIRYLKPGVRKGQWQDHEDAIVIEAVTTCKEQPFTRWSDLAQKLPGRVGKQIRDRWVNHLNPNINHMPFTKEDDMKLWDGHKQLGKRWVEISTKFFKSSRSENHIKNRWYSASFKKFVATEFGPDAYIPCDKKTSRKPKNKGKK